MSDGPVEQPKPVDLDAAVPAAVEPAVEESTAVTETPAPVVEETPQETPATAAEDLKEAAKPAETEKAEKTPKGPGILAKLIAPFNKKKGPRSPKKGKEAETPVTEEAPKPEETPATAEAVVETPKEAAEPVKEPETPAVETPAADTPAAVEQKEEKKETKSKFTRRLSARVGDLFRKPKSEVPATARVDEHPPKIDEPTPVAPLENPASESSAPGAPAQPSEPAKPVEPAPAATPVVAAAAS